MTNATSFKYGFIGGLVLIFCLWLGWYTFSYLKIEKAEVQKTAVAALHCPLDQIHFGPSYQFNDGPGEFPVDGCGKQGRIFCDDHGYRYGMVKQYFVVDLTCRFQDKK